MNKDLSNIQNFIDYENEGKSYQISIDCNEDKLKIILKEPLKNEYYEKSLTIEDLKGINKKLVVFYDSQIGDIKDKLIKVVNEKSLIISEIDNDNKENLIPDKILTEWKVQLKKKNTTTLKLELNIHEDNNEQEDGFIKYDDKYSIKLFLNEKENEKNLDIILLENNNNNKKIKYKSTFTYEEIVNLDTKNILCNLYDNIEEIHEEFEQIIEDKKIKILHKNKSEDSNITITWTSETNQDETQIETILKNENNKEIEIKEKNEQDKLEFNPINESNNNPNNKTFTNSDSAKKIINSLDENLSFSKSNSSVRALKKQLEPMNKKNINNNINNNIKEIKNDCKIKKENNILKYSLSLTSMSQLYKIKEIKNGKKLKIENILILNDNNICISYENKKIEVYDINTKKPIFSMNNDECIKSSFKMKDKDIFITLSDNIIQGWFSFDDGLTEVIRFDKKNFKSFQNKKNIQKEEDEGELNNLEHQKDYIYPFCKGITDDVNCGKFITSSQNGVIELWEINFSDNTIKYNQSLKCHEWGYVNIIQLNNGNVVTSCTEDKTINFCDLDNNNNKPIKLSGININGKDNLLEWNNYELIVCGIESITFIDYNNYNIINVIKYPEIDYIESITLLYDTSNIIIKNDKCCLFLFDLMNKKVINNDNKTLKITEEGMIIYVNKKHEIIITKDNELEIYSY